jgi:F0F1-type ATP synthase delta subunit
VLNLFLLLLQKKRLLILADIVETASDLIYKFSGHAFVTLDVPNVFNETDLPQIQKRIEDVCGPALLKVNKNSEMIGGFKATCGFKVIDASVENCLSQLSAALH